MNRLVFLFLSLALLVSPSILTGDQVEFGFGEPEVIKLDWSTRSLSSTDINSDGLRDLVVINNDAGKIELLYQLPEGEPAKGLKKSVSRNRWDPVLEDELFEKRAITVGFPVYDLAVHDLNGDGLVDLAYTAGEIPLTIRYQTEGGEWAGSKEYDGFEALGWPNTIKAEDFDNDGFIDLVLLSEDAIRVFTCNSDGTMGEPKLLYISGENPFNLMLSDVTGDNRSDLLYLSTDGKQVLAMREQLEGGMFGPEQRQVMERPARMIEPLVGSAVDSNSLVSVSSRSGTFDFMHLKQVEGGAEQQSALKCSPDIYPIFKRSRDPASYSFGDIDGDGDDDLVVANPAEAALIVFEKSEGSFQGSKPFPSFSKVSSLASGHFFKRQSVDVIVLSEAEQTLGFSRMDKNGRLSFPSQISVGEGDAVVVAAMDMDGDDYDELVTVNEKDGSYTLFVSAPESRKSDSSKWEIVFQMELDGVRRKPYAIAALDMFSKDKPGLILFVPREAPVLLGPDAQSDAVSFRVLADKSSIRENLFKALEPAQVSLFDVSGDGKNELVVARTGFARAFSFNQDQLEMVDQFNARRGGDVIDAVIPIRSSDEIDGLVFYVSEQREMQFLRRDSDNVFRYENSSEVGSIDLIDWHSLSARGDEHKDTFIFAGEDRFWHFNHIEVHKEWVVEETYETDLEDIHYSHVVASDFNGDHSPELVALDGSQHIVDILSKQKDDWSSRMFWQVFEQNMHYQGRTGAKLEPRQILIDDFTGDGLADLVLLVHDRVLIYPQK